MSGTKTMRCLVMAALIALALLPVKSAWGQATLLPNGKTCFSGTTGITGMVGTLGSITGGASYTTGTYGGVALTGGTGSGATANITVSGGVVTAVAILAPGTQYTVGDILSASSASIGGTGGGFSVPILSVSINSSLAGGTVGYYTPNTLTFKTTWRNAAQTVVNSNPVPLDQNGCAVIYGLGSYRQIVKDSLGNTIWDAVTASTLTSVPGTATSGAGDFLPVGAIIPVAGYVAPANYAFSYGQSLLRSSYPDALSALTISSSAGCTNGSTIVGGITSTAQMRVGAPIEANCIPVGATIATIATANSITVSAAATATGGTTIRVFNYGNGDGSTTFTLPDLRGRVFPAPDAMGGVAANRLQTTYYGAVASPPGVAGGSQSNVLIGANLPPYTPAGSVAVTDTSTWLSNNQLLWNNGTGPFAATAGGANWGVGQQAVTRSGSATAAFTGTAQGGTSTPFAVIQPSLTINYAIKIQNGTLPTVGVLSLGGMTGDILCGSGILCSGGTISADPSTVTLLNARIFVGNAGNIATGVPLSGDCSLVAAGIITCTTFNGGTTFGTMAGQSAGAVAITGGTIAGLPNPSASSEAATKGYVDAVATGLRIQTPVKLATTAALAANTYANGAAGVGATLTANANGALSIDSVAVTAADRVLVKDEAAPANNGIYTVTATGSGAACPGAGCYVLTRATDFDTAAEMLASSFVTVTAGTVNINKGFILQTTVATVGTTAVVWISFPSSTSQWTTSATDIYYNLGGVGVGTTTPAGFSTDTATYLALSGQQQGVNVIGELGIGGNITSTSNAVGAVAFFNSALGTADKRVAQIFSSTSGATNSGTLRFATWNAGVFGERMSIAANGNVGIGALTPTAGLHVGSTIKFSGITGSTTAGCLTNDTSGNISAGGNCGTSYVFNVKAPPYNATGNGSTDDAAAIQSAVNDAAAAGRGAIYFPCGIYKINTRITTAAFPTFDRVQFIGDGGGCSQINVNNANGGFLAQITSLTFGSKFGFRELDIVCASGGACGTAISVIVTTVVTGDGNLNNLDIHNVRIRSLTDNASVEKYTNGVYLKNLSNTDIYNLEIVQGSSNSGKGIYLDFANNTGLTPGYGIRMYNFHVEAMEYGFYSTGGLEGIQFYNPGLFGVNTGIRIDGSGGFTGRAGDLTISGGSINAKNKAIYVNQWKSIRISDMDLYKGVGSGTDVCDHALYFENTQWTLLSNNHIATAISLSPCSSALVTGNAVEKFIMTGNSLQAIGSISVPGIKVFGGAVLTNLSNNVIDNLGGQLAINVNSNYVTCFGNAGGGTGGISTAGSFGGINCSAGNNNF